MGPIQSDLSKILNTVSGIAVAGKKFSDDLKQQKLDAEEIKMAEEKKIKEETAAKKQQLKAEKKEAQDVALEADVMKYGVAPESAIAYRLAKERGVKAPERKLFNDKGEFAYTYSDMATLLANESLADSLSQRLKGRNAIKFRRELLSSGKDHKERVKQAILSIGWGGK